MAREIELDSVDPNYEMNRHTRRTEASLQIVQVKNKLDMSLRGTKDERVRTLMSTAYNLICEASDLVDLAHVMDEDEAR